MIRFVTRCGLTGKRVGEASNPGPGSHGRVGRNVVARITGRISATQLDSDEELLMCAVCSVPSQDFGSGGHHTREVATADTIPASSHSRKPECKLRGEESDGAASTQPTPVAPFDSVEDALEYDLTRQDSDTKSIMSASDAESNGSVEGPPTAAIDTPIEQEVRAFLGT